MFSKFIRHVTYYPNVCSLITHDFAQCPLARRSFGFCSHPRRYKGPCYKWRNDYHHLDISCRRPVCQPKSTPFFPLLTVFLATPLRWSWSTHRSTVSSAFPTMLTRPLVLLLWRSRLFLLGMFYSCFVWFCSESPSGSDYTIEAVNIGDINQIYATTPSFPIGATVTGSTSGAASTSVTGASTSTATPT